MACEAEQLAYDKGLAKVAVWQVEQAVSQAEATYAGIKLSQATEQLARLRMKLDDCRNGCACTIPEPSEDDTEELLSSIHANITELIAIRSSRHTALAALG